MRILPPIQPGLHPDEFFKQLIEVTEQASDELLLEAARDNPTLPLPPTAKKRLAELQGKTAD